MVGHEPCHYHVDVAVRKGAELPLREVDYRERAQLPQHKRGACHLERHVHHEYRRQPELEEVVEKVQDVAHR